MIYGVSSGPEQHCEVRRSGAAVRGRLLALGSERRRLWAAVLPELLPWPPFRFTAINSPGSAAASHISWLLVREGWPGQPGTCPLPVAWALPKATEMSYLRGHVTGVGFRELSVILISETMEGWQHCLPGDSTKEQGAGPSASGKLGFRT